MIAYLPPRCKQKGANGRTSRRQNFGIIRRNGQPKGDWRLSSPSGKARRKLAAAQERIPQSGLLSNHRRVAGPAARRREGARRGVSAVPRHRGPGPRCAAPAEPQVRHPLQRPERRAARRRPQAHAATGGSERGKPPAKRPFRATDWPRPGEHDSPPHSQPPSIGDWWWGGSTSPLPLPWWKTEGAVPLQPRLVTMS